RTVYVSVAQVCTPILHYTPIFVIMLTDDMLKRKTLVPNVKDDDIYEMKSKKKYKDFKNLAGGHNRVVSMVKNIDQITSAVLESIIEIDQLNELQGWVREENNLSSISLETKQQLQRLIDENNQLHTQLNELKLASSPISEKIGNYTYDEILFTLKKKSLEIDESMLRIYGLNHENPTLLYLFEKNDLLLMHGIPTLTNDPLHSLLMTELVPTLRILNLIEKVITQKLGSHSFTSWALNDSGRTFLGKFQGGFMNTSGQL
ncbi:hypothetical protein QK289_15810, partial [Exiguobacterium antarcticum]